MFQEIDDALKGFEIGILGEYYIDTVCLLYILLFIRIHFAAGSKCAYYNLHTLLVVHTSFDWYGTEP